MRKNKTEQYFFFLKDSSFSSSAENKSSSSSRSTWSQFQSQNPNSGKCPVAHSNQRQASSLKFSGMNLGDVTKVTVMEEMKILEMTKDVPLDLSVKNKFHS